jgi:ribose transport system permease protein
MTLRERALRLRYNYVPDHLIGEILTKRWTDSAIPFAALVITIVFFGSAIPGFFNPGSLSATTRQLGEFSIIVTGLTIVVLGGGIDLSVGSIFALANFAAVGCFFVWGQPVWVCFLAAMATGFVFGCLNGYLVGYMRMRAFLTTLVTLIIGRAIFDILVISFNTQIQTSMASSDLWDFIGDGSVFGDAVPNGPSIAVAAAVVIAIFAHIAITRSRPGWHILAVGGSRRSAYNSGIRVKRTVFMTYVISGLCCGLAGFLIACRLSGAGPGTGAGLEIAALTAVVVGGNSLGGGRGSIVKAIMGAIIVLVMTNGLIRLGFGTGVNQMVLGLLLGVAVVLDIRWLKNRHKVLSEVYVAPVHYRMGETHSAVPGSGTPYALSDKLSKAEPIGLGELEGPEDVILDHEDHLYAGTRHGEIVRYLAPDYKRSEVFAHIGGFPLGLAMDRDGSIKSCVGAMGLYSIDKDRKVTRLSTETNRSWTSILDDARLRDPNDCDIAPDGRIFFTDSTTRYDAHDWALDSIESRPTGRLLVYDPRDGSTKTLVTGLRYANGVCMAHDGQSLFMAESWACSVHRYWFDGPKKGQLERVIGDMPGYPDNINRASDGTYWMAWLGMRKRMTRRLPQDEWLFPNINTGGVVKFDESGRIVDALGDLGGESHPMVTSMREHKGYLYIGGILNNRIGRYRVEGADPSWTSWSSYWGGNA